MIDIIAREKGSLKWHHETFIFRFEHYVTFKKRMTYLDTCIKHPIFYITLELLIYWENSILLKRCFDDSEFDAAWIEFMFSNYASAPSLSCKYLENIYLDISPSDKNMIVIKSYYGVSWMSLMFSKIMKNFHVPYVFTDNIHRHISNFILI